MQIPCQIHNDNSSFQESTSTKVLNHKHSPLKLENLARWETTVRSVHREIATFLRTEGREAVSLGGLVALLARLSAARLMLAEHFKLGLETKLRLNVSTEEINFALKDNSD